MQTTKSLSVFILAAVIFSLLNNCARSPGYHKERAVGGNPQSDRERERIIDSAQKFNSLKKRVVVLPLWNDTPVKGKFENLGKNALKDYLLEQNKVNIVDDKDISFRSQDFYLDQEKINVAHIAENGKKWGVSLVILGRISKIIFRHKDDDVGVFRPSSALAAANVELRMVDTSLAKETALGEGAGKSQNSSLNLFGQDEEGADQYRDDTVRDAIADAIRAAMPALNKELDRVQWRGKIAKITGAKIYINAGRATGLNVGDILKVSSMGQDIFDPDNGLFLGRTHGDLKGTLEVSEYFGEDGAITRVHSGANFLEGDSIQLY